MEELLNKLIEKGWKPFGVEAKKIYIDKNEITIERLNGFRVVYTTRQISSIDSGLWQFVCGNGMVEKGGLFWELGYSSGEIDLESRVRRQDYEYRLIESSLKDESELEEFLLDNIKVEG